MLMFQSWVCIAAVCTYNYTSTPWVFLLAPPLRSLVVAHYTSTKLTLQIRIRLCGYDHFLNLILVAYFYVQNQQTYASPTFLSCQQLSPHVPLLLLQMNTNIQLMFMAVTFGTPVFNCLNYPFLHFLWGSTATTTPWAFASYLRVNA